MRIKKSIQKDYLRINDSHHMRTYGFSQMWYRDSWQKKAGCGPTAATNQLLYLNQTEQIALPKDYSHLGNQMNLLHQVWDYVTPTMMGVNKTDIFYQGMNRYIQDYQLPLASHYLDIPLIGTPPLSDIIEFVSGGLEKNTPVAFLNLINKKLPYLDNWHWVTIVAIDYENDLSSATAEIFDGYQHFNLDLAKWHKGRMMGGGLVYLSRQ